jgi:hypothetical protein
MVHSDGKSVKSRSAGEEGTGCCVVVGRLELVAEAIMVAVLVVAVAAGPEMAEMTMVFIECGRIGRS